MSAPSYTAGPWLVEEGHIQRDSGGIRYWQITDGQDAIACNQFCYAGHDAAVNEANARLIAAAPALLKALKDILGPLNVCSDNPNVGDDVCLPIDMTMGELRAARAAISLAGEGHE